MELTNLEQLFAHFDLTSLITLTVAAFGTLIGFDLVKAGARVVRGMVKRIGGR